MVAEEAYGVVHLCREVREVGIADNDPDSAGIIDLNIGFASGETALALLPMRVDRELRDLQKRLDIEIAPTHSKDAAHVRIKPLSFPIFQRPSASPSNLS